jgi:hypothetical protein
LWKPLIDLEASSNCVRMVVGVMVYDGGFNVCSCVCPFPINPSLKWLDLKNLARLLVEV